MLTSQGRPDSALRLVVLRDWDGLERMLHSLSNMELRRMERVMREEVLPTLDNALFWEALLHLIIYKRSAFIAGVVAVEHLAKDGTLDFRTESVNRLYEHLRETDEASVVKLCNMMLPQLRTEAQVMEMWRAFHVDGEVARLGMLLKVDSELSYYLLFKTLKLVEDKAVARKCCATLIRRQDDRAFNAVCIIKAYFGLDDLPGRFSLKIEPYELSHIDRDFDTFRHALGGKRPRL